MKPQTRPFIVEIKSSRRRLANIDARQRAKQAAVEHLAVMLAKPDGTMDAMVVSRAVPAEAAIPGNN